MAIKILRTHNNLKKGYITEEIDYSELSLITIKDLHEYYSEKLGISMDAILLVKDGVIVNPITNLIEYESSENPYIILIDISNNENINSLDNKENINPVMVSIPDNSVKLNLVNSLLQQSVIQNMITEPIESGVIYNNILNNITNIPTPDPVNITMYSSELSQLEDIGFNNREINIEAEGGERDIESGIQKYG